MFNIGRFSCIMYLRCQLFQIKPAEEPDQWFISQKATMQYRPEKHSLIDVIKAVVLTTIVVSALGYLDYITGEISIDILYILCLCVVTWFTGTLMGVLCVIELIFAKTTADYYDHIKIGSHLYEWNTLNYVFVYFTICLLVGKLRKVLSR